MRYLTKEWYIACQADPMTPEVQKQLDEIDRAYCAAQTRETLPDGLLQQFFFHDGVVREIITGTDLTLRIDSPYSERNRRDSGCIAACWSIGVVRTKGAACKDLRGKNRRGRVPGNGGAWSTCWRLLCVYNDFTATRLCGSTGK